MDEEIRVVHVDDDPSFAALVAEFLQRDNQRFTVETANSVDEGLDLLSPEVDCIVSDYDMPGKSGLEFLETVRDRYPELPFILFTGKGSETVASEAISAGVTGYIRKEGGTGQYALLGNRIENAVEQYRAQQELAENRRRLELFFEQSPLGVIEWTKTFEFESVNAAAEEILGYTEAELQGRDWECIVPESEVDDVGAVISEIRAAEGGSHSINENVTADGDRIVCDWYNRVITDGEGEVVAAFSLFQDVTERERRKQDFARIERRYRTLFEDPTRLVLVLDPDGTVLEANEPAQSYGSDPVGQKLWDLSWWNDEDSVREHVEQAADGAKVQLPAALDGDVSARIRPVLDGETVTALFCTAPVPEQSRE